MFKKNLHLNQEHREKLLEMKKILEKRDGIYHMAESDVIRQSIDYYYKHLKGRLEETK